MDANKQAEKTLKELHFDFAAFTLAGFLQAAGQARGRQIVLMPWDKMPIGVFGAWLSDGDYPKEYIFYDDSVPEIHQIHIQLHELAHFLLGHETHKVTREQIDVAATGQAALPFDELAQLRSGSQKHEELQAETLADLIQKNVVRHARINQLAHATDPEGKLAGFIKTMGAK